jgi:hypothetical protein
MEAAQMNEGLRGRLWAMEPKAVFKRVAESIKTIQKKMK